MRFDIVTIFPDYFAPLELSLLGKAQVKGLVTTAVHDLRQWTEDVHRTVDGTPCGGGAGMVMRPDIWGKALDEILATPLAEGRKRVLAIPTPAGRPLTQALVQELSNAGQIVIACGRYEGIDERVARYYESRGQAQRAGAADAAAGEAAAGSGHAESVGSGRAETGRPESREATLAADTASAAPDGGMAGGVGEKAEAVEVLEFSLGDYVLNGGEAAALVLFEAVGRLLPEVMGNPESLTEESHGGAGLLEYPSYTRPVSWRGAQVPPVLLGGDHAAIEAWRQHQSLQRTIERRPDLLGRLRAEQLSLPQREDLVRAGWIYPLQSNLGQPVSIYLLGSPTAGSPAAAASEASGEAELPASGVSEREIAELVDLARATFPLACPPQLGPEAIEDFMNEEFDPALIAQRLAQPEKYRYLVARSGERLIGYTLTHTQLDPAERALNLQGGLAYLSKCYALPEYHGSGLAGALLEAAVEDLRAANPQASGLVLGTNQANKRAQRFYRRHGFAKRGTRIFYVGQIANRDVVMVRTF